MTISYGDTSIIINVLDTSYRLREVCGINALTIYFSMPDYQDIPVGAICEFRGSTYTLMRKGDFKKSGSRDYEYTIVMYSDYAKMSKYRVRNTADNALKFVYTGTPEQHLQLIVDNMNRRDTGWSVGTCLTAGPIMIEYNHVSCEDALSNLDSEFETEHEVVGKVISLGKVEKFKSDPLNLSYGKNNGLKPQVTRTSDTSSQPIDIVFPQSTDRNIDYSVYGSKYLKLPASQTIGYDGNKFSNETGYDSTKAKTYAVSSDGLSVQSSTPTNDSNEGSLDCSEIYPSRVGEITSVSTETQTNSDGEQETVYNIIDTSIPEALDYSDCQIAGETALVRFQTGALAGRDFDIATDSNGNLTGYVHAQRLFKLVNNEQDGFVMPGGNFVPAVGDKYAVFGIQLPEAYTCDNDTKTGASWDMFRACVKHLWDNGEQKVYVKGELDGIYAKRNWNSISDKIVPGGYVHLTDADFAPDGVDLRITSVKEFINYDKKPVIELSNSTVSSGLSSKIADIDKNEVMSEYQNQQTQKLMKRQALTMIETQRMLAASQLDYSAAINPITVNAMQMLAGDKSLQYDFVTSVSDLTVVTHEIEFNAGKQIITPAGVICHRTLGLGNVIQPTHQASEYKRWNVAAYTSDVLTDKNKTYYLYIKASKTLSDNLGAATWVLSETSIAMESVDGYYHLLAYIVGGEYDGDRSIVTMYGYSEILPAQITTPKIQDSGANLVIDLVNKIITAVGGAEIISDSIKFRASDGDVSIISGGKFNTRMINTDELIAKMIRTAATGKRVAVNETGDSNDIVIWDDNDNARVKMFGNNISLGSSSTNTASISSIIQHAIVDSFYAFDTASFTINDLEPKTYKVNIPAMSIQLHVSTGLVQNLTSVAKADVVGEVYFDSTLLGSVSLEEYLSSYSNYTESLNIAATTLSVSNGVHTLQFRVANLSEYDDTFDTVAIDASFTPTGGGNIKYNVSINDMQIGCNGMLVQAASDQYFIVKRVNNDANMEFTFRSGDYGIRCTTSNGLQKTSNGGNTWSSL